jgi:ATP-dependent RNA helicase DHX29
MKSVAASDSKQSEAYISTAALFHIFSGNAKDEKVGLRLPPVWKDLWSEMAEAKKNYLDTQDREAVRSLRTLVRQRQDQELEDGVLAFRGRGTAKTSSDVTQNGPSERSRINTASVEAMQKIWNDKASTSKFQMMLVCRTAYDTVLPVIATSD